MKDWQAIFTRILDSPANEMPVHVRWLFVVMLLLKEDDHILRMDERGLRKRANLTNDHIKEGLEMLTKDNMIRESPDGWIIVNGEKYYDLMKNQRRRQQKNESQNQIRAAQRQAEPAPIRHPANAYPAVESSTEPRRAISEKPAVNGDCVAEFDQFWAAYPKKRNFIEAQRAFVESRAKGHIQEILDALKWQERSQEWLDQGGKFIPSPVTYLSDRRWQEENMELKALMPKPECESMEQREIRLAQEFAMLKQAPLTPEERLRRTKQPPR